MLVIEGSALLHFIIMVLSLYCFIAFVYWWVKKGSATFIYGITTMLIFGIFLTNGGAYLAYLDFLDDGIMQIIQNWWWPLRSIPMALALCVYAVHITLQIRDNS